MTSSYYGNCQVMPDLPFIQFQLKTPKCSTQDKIWQQHSWLIKREAHIQIPILCLLAGHLTRWSQKLKPEMSTCFSLDQKLVAKVTSQKTCAKLNISRTSMSMCLLHPSSGHLSVFSISINGTISSCFNRFLIPSLSSHSLLPVRSVTCSDDFTPEISFKFDCFFLSQHHYHSPGSPGNFLGNSLISIVYAFLFHLHIFIECQDYVVCACQSFWHKSCWTEQDEIPGVMEPTF